LDDRVHAQQRLIHKFSFMHSQRDCQCPMSGPYEGAMLLTFWMGLDYSTSYFVFFNLVTNISYRF
jgi:hypothetical protein